ncbi:hypothetical protein HanRHA438_Chr05g0214261 [Helianthus annuus]|nr:hypothetical protein HanRHA438_Chr05g0214261 [Helianthus annuus]
MSRISLNSKKNKGGTLHHTLNANHTRKATGQAVNKCSTVSSESLYNGHMTEVMSTFLLLKLTLVGSLSILPLQGIMLHLIGTHLHQAKFGR